MENQRKVEIDQSRLEYLEALEKEKELRELKEELPHLYLHPLYKWQKEFIDQTNKSCWICCSNQSGKSTAQLIKCILLATEPSLWPLYFSSPPRTFWYFYPRKGTATIEYYEKWKKVYLPKGKMKDHPQYGWTEDIRQKDIHSIKFNTGVTLYFFSYEMKPENIQATTVDYCCCDEEIPKELYSEIIARLFYTQGMFSCVFTATLGQDWVRRIIEGNGEDRIFPDSWRRQVSMYECQIDADGNPTKFTNEYIERIKAQLPNDTEIQRRVYGKFVVAGGLVYPAFDIKENVIPAHPVPRDWLLWAAVDIGSGGESGHPAAIVFIATNKEITKGRVTDCWRGDDVETAASDILEQYRKMKGKRTILSACYDYSGAGKDFGIISSRMGEPFIKADKQNRDQGTNIVNTLFKNKMLQIYEDKESRKLTDELISLKVETPKTKARDDLIDALKYCCVQIPWDFSCINAPLIEKINKNLLLDERERYILKQKSGVSPNKRDDDINNQENLILGELSEWDDYFNE